MTFHKKSKAVRNDMLHGNPEDVLIAVILRAYKDAVSRNAKEALAARRMLTDRGWVCFLSISIETARRIRRSIPPLKVRINNLTNVRQSGSIIEEGRNSGPNHKGSL